MTPINIYVNQQLDGITFSLSPSTRKEISKEFPDAFIAGSLFVNYGTKSDFEQYHTKVERFIVPVLLGLNEDNIKKISTVNFIDPTTNQTLFSYSNE